MNLEAFRLIILSIGWPVMAIGGIIILLKAIKFNKKLHSLPLGKIIVSMTIGQIFSMISLGIVSTVFMFIDIKTGVYIIMPIFIIWLITIIANFIISFKWSQEAAKINILYYKVKERAEEIKKEKEKLTHVASNMPTGVIFLDGQGKIMFINREAKNIAGFDSNDDEEIYGAILGKFFKYQLKDKINQCLEGHPSSIMNIKLDGKIYEIHLRNLIDRDKSINNYFGHFIWIRNVTQEKLLTKAKENFITIASHKLRTPVSGIKLLSENLLSNEKIDKNSKKIIKEINKSSKLLTELVNNIIQNIDYDTKEIKAQLKYCDFKKITKDLIEYYNKKNIIKCKIKFTSHEKGAFSIQTDEYLLKKIIKIFIKNALIYNQDNCTINIQLAKKENQAILSIQDNGIGISEESKNLIFSNFYRAENAIKKYTEGTGTNLFIAKKIIASLGGKIWFDSILDKGSTFYISIPLTKHNSSI